MMSYYTGFNGYDHFMLIFNILGPAAFDLNYKCGLWSPQDQLFLTLIKLRQAKDNVELAMLLHVCENYQNLDFFLLSIKGTKGTILALKGSHMWAHAKRYWEKVSKYTGHLRCNWATNSQALKYWSSVKNVASI